MPNCKLCGKKFPNRVSIDGKIRVLKNRTKCLVCLPFKQKQPKQTIESFRKKNCEKYKQWYAINGHSKITARRVARKRALVRLCGGSCQVCGYDRCLRNLAWHHIDPSEKSFQISSEIFQRNPRFVILEAMKCILVCHNCHGEIHSNLICEDKIYDLNKSVRENLLGFLEQKWETILVA